MKTIITTSSPQSLSFIQLTALQAKQFSKQASNWMVLLVFLGSGVYALYQGYADKRSKVATIQAFRQEKDSLLQDMSAAFSADTSKKEGRARYRKSRMPGSALFNIRLPSYKLPVSTAIYNVGQSDVFTYYYLFGAENFEMQLLKQTEISNPLKALAGHFDVSFWLVYLVPLMILLFSFNVLSAERDNGNWRLIAAQGIAEKNWLQSRFAIVGCLSLVLLSLILISGITINAVIFKQGPELSDFLFFLTAITYLIFWLSLFYCINSLRKPTTYNAMLCGITWISFCLVVPVLISKLAEVIVPVDNTRISMYSRRPQNPKIEADKAFAAAIIKRLALMDSHFSNADDDSTNPVFYVRVYQALHLLLHKERWPVVQEYFFRIEKRQHITDWSAFINPAGSTDGYLTALADNDAAAFHHFTGQTEELQHGLHNVFYPVIFSDTLLSRKNYEGLPRFSYLRSSIPVSLAGYFIIMMLISTALISLAHQQLRKPFS